MRIDVLTLFPEMFAAVLGGSILKRAAEKKLVSYHLHQLRDHTKDVHKKVDDRPFGGGPGMVLMCQPVLDAVRHVQADDVAAATCVFLSPQGRRFTQRLAGDLASQPRLLFVCGHYEGFDQRILDLLSPMEISIGDYVLSGGELPAMVVIDAVVRLVPGVLGHADSTAEESFSANAQGATTLEYPHYTRPREYEGLSAPDVLLSGDHEAIKRWRAARAMERTQERRPDLLP